MAGLHILGFSADMINNVVFKNTMSLTLTNDVIRTCDTKAKFKKALYDCLGSWIIEDNFDAYSFKYNEAIGGVCLSYGTNNTTDYINTPLFKTKSIPIPKTFTIGWYYENNLDNSGVSPCADMRLNITTASKGTTTLFQLWDNGSGNNTSYSVKIYVNNGKTILTDFLGNGVFTNTKSFTVPDQVPNCVSTTDTECVLSFNNALYTIQGGASTKHEGYPYITSLQMDFS